MAEIKGNTREEVLLEKFIPRIKSISPDLWMKEKIVDVTHYCSGLGTFIIVLYENRKSENRKIYRLDINEHYLQILSCQDDRIERLYKEVQEKVDAYMKVEEPKKVEDAINRLEAELEKE